MAGYKYKEAVSDEQLINLIDQGIQNSTGDWLNSSDLTRERLKATYEYAGVAQEHLAPQGVSSIVDTNTCLLYTSPSPRDGLLSRMPSSA